MIRRMLDRMRRFFTPVPRPPPPPPPIESTPPTTPLDDRAAFMTAVNEESRSRLYDQFEMLRTSARERRP